MAAGAGARSLSTSINPAMLATLHASAQRSRHEQEQQDEEDLILHMMMAHR